MFVSFLKYEVMCLLLLFAITKSDVYAQQKNKINNNGYNIFYYPNGNISSEGTMKNGKPEGYWKTYFESGILKTEGNRINFLLEGNWKFYKENKLLEKEINYENNKKEGWSIWFNDSNKVIKKEYYINDLKDSLTIFYYENKTDKIFKTVPFKKGIEEGVGFEYSIDQRVITITRFKKGVILSEEKINRYDKNGLKQDVWKEFYENNNLKIEARYINDKLNGYYKEYTKDGKLSKAVLYIDGEIHEDERLQTLDLRQEYYENGTPKVIGTYNVRGEKHGKFKYFNEKGLVEEQIIYSNNTIIAKGKIDEEERRQGYWEEYYPNGEIKSKGKYVDGEKIDSWEYYFISGKKEQEGKYVKGGKQDGLWLWYYETGKILRKEEFRKGLEDGPFVEYFADGKIITQGEFLDGKKEGFWFYELNDHKEEGNYKNGLKDGYWKYYNVLTGKLVFEGSFFEGLENSKFKFWYPSGKLYEEGTYVLGKREGIWKRYNELGEEIIRFDYNNNKEIKIDGSTLKFPNYVPE
jgi:antitoxin component YwqK of YwqJK toxin-antitoxin module